MREIAMFADVTGSVNRANSLDAQGSTIDQIFAEAIVANEPTSVLDESGIIRVQKVPEDVDKATFPIVENTTFTWETISRTTNSAGSLVTSAQLTSPTYVEITPQVVTTSIFLADNVSLLNKTDFEFWTMIAARDAARKKEFDALAELGSPSKATLLYAANSFTAGSAVDSGSTITPGNLLSAKTVLKKGNFKVNADYVLLHPDQYEDLNSAHDFAPGAGGAATSDLGLLQKAEFSKSGDLVRFAGMDIYVTELMPSVGSTSLGADIVDDQVTTLSRPVIVGQKGLAIGRAEKEGMKVSTFVDPRRHGQWKVLDMYYDVAILAGSSYVNILSAV